MPTVAMDIRTTHDTGVARYGQRLLAALVPLLEPNDLTLTVVGRDAELAAVAPMVPDRHPVRLVCAPDDDGFARRSPWLRRYLAGRPVDLFYTPHYLVDRNCEVPYVHTVHDLIRWRFPAYSYTDTTFADRFGMAELRVVTHELEELAPWDDTAGGEVFARYFRAINRRLAAGSAGLCTVSEASATDIVELLDVARPAVMVIPPGVSRDIFVPRRPSEVSRVTARLGLAGPYCMLVGLAHPHKRIPWLLRALATIRRGLPRGSRLVIAGGHAELSVAVLNQIEALALADLVTFTGRLSDAELAALYTGARALIAASIAEGSGLPPQEALACGCEVIGSDIGPLRETVGAHAHLIPPDDDGAFAAAMLAAFRGDLPSKSRGYRPHTWPESSRKLVDVFVKVAAGDFHPSTVVGAAGE